MLEPHLLIAEQPDRTLAELKDALSLATSCLALSDRTPPWHYRIQPFRSRGTTPAQFKRQLLTSWISGASRSGMQ